MPPPAHIRDSARAAPGPARRKARGRTRVRGGADLPQRLPSAPISGSRRPLRAHVAHITPRYKYPPNVDHRHRPPAPHAPARRPRCCGDTPHRPAAPAPRGMDGRRRCREGAGFGVPARWNISESDPSRQSQTGSYPGAGAGAKISLAAALTPKEAPMVVKITYTWRPARDEELPDLPDAQSKATH